MYVKQGYKMAVSTIYNFLEILPNQNVMEFRVYKSISNVSVISKQLISTDNIQYSIRNSFIEQ